MVLKNGYGFVEFDNHKDADDAVYDLHGRELRGERIIVEHARQPPGARGGSRRSGGRDRRFGPPTRTEYRVIVENLSSRVSWQDLKDMMRKAGDVTYADAHKSARNDGIVEFSSYADMKEAIEKFDGYELYGRVWRVYEDRPTRRSRSDSRGRSVSSGRGRKYGHRSRSRDSYRRRKSPSPRRHRDRSNSSDRGKSVSRERKDSREASVDGRSRSVSNRSVSRDRQRSVSQRSARRSDRGSQSPSRNGKDVSPREEPSRSRSKSNAHSRSASRSVASRSGGSRTPPSRSRSQSNRSRSPSGHHSEEAANGSDVEQERSADSD